MLLSRRLGIALSLATLPLLLANRGCEPDLHSAEGTGDDSSENAPLASQGAGAQDAATHADAGATQAGGGSGTSSSSADAGASVGADAALKPDTGSVAGARCGTRGAAACAADEFCDFAPDSECGALDQGGVCSQKPEICTTIYAPVCGCDGKTYASDCTGHAAGVSVMKKGECGTAPSNPKPGSGKTCGGFAGLQCAKGEFCNYEVAAGGQGCEGIADGAGVCQATPQACTLEYKPVCGCDHRTYDSECAAHAKGASVLHSGMCTDVDCKAIGGRPVDGIGPSPECAKDETDFGWIRYSGGQVSIEGTICCVK